MEMILIEQECDPMAINQLITPYIMVVINSIERLLLCNWGVYPEPLKELYQRVVSVSSKNIVNSGTKHL